MQRILLKNFKNDIFRICSFGHYTDYKGEGYMKFSFPDLKDAPLFFNSQIPKNPEEKNLIEFSSHFCDGVTHFKTSNQKRLYRNKSESTFINSKIIHILAYLIYDLGHFKKFTKKVSSLDYQISNKFNPSKGKIFEFYLSKVEDKIILPKRKYKDITFRKYHPLISKDKKCRMLMIENDFKKFNKNVTGVSLFRRYEQKEKYIKVKLPK